SGQCASELVNNLFGNEVFRTLHRHIIAAISEDDGCIVIVLSKDFANTNFVHYKHFATLALQLGTPIFQRGCVCVTSFSSKPNDDGWERLTSISLFDGGP